MGTRRYCDQCEQDLPGILAPWKVSVRNRPFAEEFCSAACLAQWLIAHPAAAPPEPATVTVTPQWDWASGRIPSPWRHDPT